MSFETTRSLLNPVGGQREWRPRLVQLKGEATEVGRVLVLEYERTIIGRTPDGVQFVVNDHGVSRRHAAIERVGDTFRVVDCGSRNGTWVNGSRVKSATLQDGDRLQLGGAIVMRFTTDADDEWLRLGIDQGGVALWDYAIASQEVTWSEHTDSAFSLPLGTLSKHRRALDLMVHVEDLVRVRSALALAAARGQPFEFEFRLVVGPHLRWVLCRGHLQRDAQGQPSRVVGTAVDVSDTKKREHELRRTATMFESLSDGVFLTDGAGVVVDLNSRAQMLFSLTRPKALGAQLLELLGAANATALATDAARACAEQGRWTFELELGARFFEVVAFPLRDEQTVFGAAFLFRDLSERKKLQEQVAFYDRLSALGTLSAGIAHEINNPLSFVLGSLEFVTEELRDRGGHQAELDALRDALEGARRIANTVRDMKAFSRDDTQASAAPTDARSALEMACKMTQKLTSNRATVVKEWGKNLPAVLATDSRLCQVFVNLLVNAAQAIPEGRRGRLVIRQFLENDFVVTEISDDGVGISPEHLNRIFDPFFTTKPVGVGTGLGLSICHGLVAGFGGTLSVNSELGLGTTFTVRLAVAQEAELLTQPAALAADAPRRGRLLLIDDEPLMLRSLRRTLGGTHEVTTAPGVDEALTLLGREEFDVILCDLMMPGSTGMDLYEQLAREQPELAERMIFVSGGAFTDRARDFVGHVPNAVLTKPIDNVKLSQLVEMRLMEKTGPIHSGQGFESSPSELGRA
jgi:PAS domain S-box-containing protein